MTNYIVDLEYKGRLGKYSWKFRHSQLRVPTSTCKIISNRPKRGSRVSEVRLTLSKGHEFDHLSLICAGFIQCKPSNSGVIPKIS